jgi:hypothetical protein
MRTIVAAHVEYVPTSEDKLWLHRAVDAEGEPRGQVAETLINGFMWARSELDYPKSLTAWIRSYAQPVNPRWFPHGDLFQHQYDRAKDDDERAELMRRAIVREEVHSRRLAFGSKTRLAVQHALTHAPVLPGATDYAAPSLVRPSPWVALTEPTPGRNRFWTRPGAIGWAGYRIGTAAASGGIVALALIVGYAIWRTT